MNAQPQSPGDASGEATELRWAVFVGGIVFLLLAMMVFTALHWSSMPLTGVEAISSSTLHQGGEFNQDNLGTGLDEKGHFVIHLLAEQYAYRPACLVVPAGVPVTVRATSSDVVHGFQIIGTNVNSMLVPGYVTTIVMQIDHLGDISAACHEFCGVGHASMWSTVRVVPREEVERALREHRRLSCA